MGDKVTISGGTGTYTVSQNSHYGSTPYEVKQGTDTKWVSGNDIRRWVDVVMNPSPDHFIIYVRRTATAEVDNEKEVFFLCFSEVFSFLIPFIIHETVHSHSFITVKTFFFFFIFGFT